MSHAPTGYRNVYRRGDNYYYRFKDEAGKWRERKYGPNLSDARLAQIKAQQEADAIRNGLTTRAKIEAARHKSRDYQETLNEFIAHLEAEKNTNTHIKTTRSECEFAAAALGWKTLDDINAPQMDALLVEISKKGRSARTRNDYLVKMQAFTRWCSRRRKYLPSDPLSELETINEATDPRRPVRALTPEEFASLLEAAPTRRKLAYWLAGALGLRWSEIRLVRWSHVDMERGWISLPASIAKSRKLQSVPMPAKVIEVLKAVEAEKRVGGICPRPPIQRTFRNDAAKAELKNNEAGMVHRRSLRKTFITHLALSGVDLRTAQRLARHSRPELTANIYTDPHLLDMKDAMRRIGRLHDRGAKSGKGVANSPEKKHKRKSA